MVRKSVTRMWFSDRQWMTAVTRSSLRPRMVNRLAGGCDGLDSGDGAKTSAASGASVARTTVRSGQWRSTSLAECRCR